MSKSRVLVVDDHRTYAEAVAVALSVMVDGADATHVPTGAEAIETIENGDVDVILIDWQLEQEDGIDITRQITQRPDAPHVIVVTAHHTDSLERLARQAGASAALPKHAPMATIVETIDACRTGRVLATGAPGVSTDDPEATEPTLSARQVEILWLLSTGAQTAEVATTLHLSVYTVRSYLKNAYRRLGVHSQLEAVAVARRLGLIPSEPSAAADGA